MSERVVNLLSVAVVATLLAIAVTGLLSAPRGTEDRAYALEQRLRCPVCKTVSIAESPSQTAAGMRRIVAQQVAAGRSDEEIIVYFQERYGEWVLLDPPASGKTVWLWVVAAAATLVGAGMLLTRSMRAAPVPPGLPVEDRARLAAAVAAYRDHHDDDDEP
jgi:cytochrome c-type biogenesis protein CcmH